MPIDIKEMYINIKVNYGAPGEQPEGEKRGGYVEEDKKNDQNVADNQLDDFYETVLELIHNKNER